MGISDERPKTHYLKKSRYLASEISKKYESVIEEKK